MMASPTMVFAPEIVRLRSLVSFASKPRLFTPMVKETFVESTSA